MMRPMSLLLLALVGAGCDSSTPPPAAAESAQTQTATLSVEGMTCEGCAAGITVAAGAVAGVSSINVSYETGSAELVYDPARTNPEAVAQVITELGYRTQLAGAVTTTAAAPAEAAATGVDPEMAAICQAGCAAQEGYDPADVVAQPGAHVGDLTRCPVSGVVFQVQPNQPTYDQNGQTWFTCCAACMGRLNDNPTRFVGGS